MKRREMLKNAAVAALGAAIPWRQIAPGPEARQRRVLFFTRSAGFEHDVIRRTGSAWSPAEKAFEEIGRRAGFMVECSKDGRIFDGSLDAYDAFAFYTSGDLTQSGGDGSPAMTPEGKSRLLAAVEGGKGFLGFHSAADTFHSPAAGEGSEAKLDPYIAMLGGEFLAHGKEQEASLLLTTTQFAGIADLGLAEGLAFTDEWFTFTNYAADLSVLLVQETAMMKGEAYRRPDYPATWTRLHGKGRVFYTSLGHRGDIWENPFFQAIARGALEWISGQADAGIRPNMNEVTPQARQTKRN